MNPIIQQQNEEGIIRLLAAQRQLYREMKTEFFGNLIVSILVATLGQLSISFDLLQAYISLLLYVYIIFEILIYFDSRQKAVFAARVQEMIDTQLFQLPISTAIVRVPEIIINRAANKLLKSPAERELLKDWYKPELIPPDMPIHKSRVVCQKINCSYEDKVRAEFIKRVTVYIIIGIIVILSIFIALNMKSRQIFGGPLFILFPLIAGAIKYIYDQIDSYKTIKRLHGICQELWTYVNSPSCKLNEAQQRSIDLQNEIRQYREKNPPVPEWLYKQIRNEVEESII